MQFLYPSFLWALAAVAIPVIVHLFNFRRTKKIFFSNVAFLRQVNTTTSSFRRLKQWLIMACRMAALACLALAFAQPIWPAKWTQAWRSGGVANVYVDNSFSMQNEVDKKTYLDRAVAAVELLLTAFPQGAAMQLLSNDFAANEHSTLTPTSLKERTTSMRFAHTPRTLEQVYRRQRQLAAKFPGQNHQFFWFSDFQKSTSGDLRKLRLDTTNRLFLMPVQAKVSQNVFVDSAWLSTPFVREMQQNMLSVRLFNSGSEPVENLAVKLFIDEAQASTFTANLNAKSSGVATFPFSVRGKGFKKARISFDDTPIAFDNDYFLVLNAAPTIQVVHLYGGLANPGYVKKVFANDSLFALRSFSLNNVDVGQLKSANLVVLEGLEHPEGAVRSALEVFVNQGGSLLVIPPAKFDLAAYTSLLTPWGIRNLAPTDASNSVLLAEPDKADVFFQDIFDQSTRQEMLSMPQSSPLLSWQVIGQKVLSLRNGQPFLTSSQASQGKVYLLASPLDEPFGDFARNALFVPVMYKIAALSVRQEPLSYSFKQNQLNLEVPNAQPNDLFKLRNGKTEIIPVQYLNGRKLSLELPKANQLNNDQSVESGYFELRLNDQTQRLLAFNHDHQESLMDYYTPGELRQLFASQKNVQVMEVLDDEDFVKTFKNENFGVALWRYFLMAALFFLAVEIALIRWMKG
jgi:Aerotolerance regulator N-terminal